MAISWSDGYWYSIWEFAPNGVTNPWIRSGPSTSGTTKLGKYSGSSGDWVWATATSGGDPEWIYYTDPGNGITGWSATWSGTWNYFDWVKNISQSAGWSGSAWEYYYLPSTPTTYKSTADLSYKFTASSNNVTSSTYGNQGDFVYTTGSGEFKLSKEIRGTTSVVQTATYTNIDTYTQKGWRTSKPSSITAASSVGLSKNFTFANGDSSKNFYAVYNNATSSTSYSNNVVNSITDPSNYTDTTSSYTVNFSDAYNTHAGQTATITKTYTFSKWTNPSGTQITFPYTFYSDTTIKANFTLSTTSVGTIVLPTPTATNYIFNGWYTKNDFTGTKYDGGADYTPSSDTTLYAKWTLNTVKLTLTKGTGISGVTIDGTATTSADIKPGASVTINATLNTGYHWKNWTSGTSTTQVSANKSYTFNMPTSATTYKANAEINTYSVAYNANGGSGTMANSTHTYGTAKSLSANTFTNFGYTFKGWATTIEKAKAGTVDYTDQKSVSNLTTTHQGIVNLYAVWELYTKVYIFTNKKDGTSKWVPATKYIYTGS